MTYQQTAARIKANKGNRVTAFVDNAGNLHHTEEAALAKTLTKVGKSGLQRILAAKDKNYMPLVIKAILRTAELVKSFK